MKDIKTQIFMKYKSFMYQKIDTVFKRTLKKITVCISNVYQEE